MIRVVCGVLADGHGKILVCRRPVHKHLGGLWEFPGGKVEEGESSEAALGRELQEELGIEVIVGKEFSIDVEWADGDVKILLRCFWCRISAGVPCAMEHEEIRWVDLCELKGFEWAEADLSFVEEILRGY